jgi:RHS repeat-associated protein
MSRKTRNLILLLAVCLGFGGRAFATSTATITVGQAAVAPSTDSITIAFNGFVETINYGQYSSAASVASAIGAMFSRDYLRDGLCAHAVGNVVTFQLRGAATFGPLDVNGPTTWFQIAGTSGWPSYSTAIADHGTVKLTLTGGTLGSTTIVAAQTNYGDGATSETIAADLAAASSANSIVSLVAIGDSLNITAVTAGAASNKYYYSLQNTAYDTTDFSQPSFPSSTITGSLQGGADANPNPTEETVYSYSVPSGGYDGVGNLLSYKDSVMGSWGFGYDTLNRLISGTPAAGNTSNNGNSLCWSYDAFGNRTTQIAQAAACPTLPSVPAQTASYNSNNQLTGRLVTYDAAGNVNTDSNTGNSYLYDAEGRICAVRSEPVAGTYTMIGYLYDADGRRVAKGNITTMTSCDPSANGFTTIKDYVLGPSGEQVTEMAVNGSTSTWTHTNAWAGGSLLATYEKTEEGLHFYLNDPLGTRRVQTNSSGLKEQSCSSFPFGDSETCSPSPTEHLFTGKERDTETGGSKGNDYFGARYYASSMGRFMSPDYNDDGDDIEPVPYADLDDPQTLNLYSYGENNPLSSIDVSGHSADCVSGGSWQDQSLVCAITSLGDKIKSVFSNLGRTSAGCTGPCVGDAPSRPPSNNQNFTPQLHQRGAPQNWAQRSAFPVMNFLDQHPAIGKLISPNCDPGQQCIISGVIPWGMTGGLGAGAAEAKTANELVTGTLKKSKSWAGEYANETYGTIKKMAASGDQKAIKMKKLIEQTQRLMEKVGGKH